MEDEECPLHPSESYFLWLLHEATMEASKRRREEDKKGGKRRKRGKTSSGNGGEEEEEEGRRFLQEIFIKLWR